MMEIPGPEAVSHDHRDELIPLLDQELNLLPDRYRFPIILCELEGKTHGSWAQIDSRLYS
jgi:RNA polymerase sigma-70 factor (ECF subfamily)